MTGIFSSDPFSEDAQIFLVSHLRTMATCFYDDDFQPYSVGELPWKNLQNDALLHNSMSLRSTVNEWLISRGVTQYAEYKTGGTAIVLAAKMQSGKTGIIRIPFRSNDAAAHKRTNNPAALQPFPDSVFPYGEDRNIEILPFVTFADLTNPIFQRGLPLLSSVYKLAGIDRGDIKGDLAILPDGTPVFGDPDQIQSAQKYTPETQRKILREFPILEPILWLKDGKPKQDLFFGGDYLSTPMRSQQNFDQEGPEESLTL